MRAFVGFLLLLHVAAAAAEECPALPPLPELSAEDEALHASWKGVAEPYSVVHWAGGYDYAPFGIGHLRVENASEHFYDWPRAIVLPVWSAPNGTLSGWIRGGYVYPAAGGAPYALTGVGTVETDYEHQTFIVWEASGDGWLRIRLAPRAEGDVWINECHLRLGAAKLRYQGWADFIREHGDWLHFRAEVPHALREGPIVNSRRITWIGVDHEMTLLEMRGDWLRVRVRQPAWTCVGSDQAFRGRVDEGWVKWRDDENGPWVWIYSRGC